MLLIKLFLLFIIIIFIIGVIIYIRYKRNCETFVDNYKIKDNNIYALDDNNNIYVNNGGNENKEIVFQYFYKTGNIQYFDIPANINELTFYCWGAGGSSKIMSIDANDKSYPFLLDSRTRTIIKPLVWYKFDTNLNIDNSGNRYNLTVVGGVIDAVNYKLGNNSVSLRNNGYLRIPNTFELNHINLVNGISISLWIRLDANSNSNAMIIEFGKLEKYMIIKRTGNKLSFEIKTEREDSKYITPDNINYFNNLWIHIVWMIDNNGEWTIYINNQKMSYNDKICIIPPFINDFTYNIGKNITGNIDDFRIYGKILRKRDIQILYEGSIRNSMIGLGGTGGFVKASLIDIPEFIKNHGNRLKIVVGESGKENGEVESYMGGGIGKNAGGGGGLSGVFTNNAVILTPILIAGGGGGGGSDIYRGEIPSSSYAKIIMIDGTNDVYISMNDIPKKFPSRMWNSITERIPFVYNGKECYKQVLTLEEEGEYEIYYTWNNKNEYRNTVPMMFNSQYNENDGIFGGRIYRTSGFYNYSSYLVSSDYKGEWVVIKMPKPIVITSYKLKRKNDRTQSLYKQAPMAFRLYASVNGINWVLIDNVLSGVYDENYYYTKVLNIDIVYNYFGLIVNRTFNETFGMLQIVEFEIYGYEMNRFNNYMNISEGDFNINYGGNGGGNIGKNGNGLNNINGKGGNMTIGGEAGESFIRNNINNGLNYGGGNGNINQAGGGSGYFGGGSSGNKYENGGLISIGGGGGGSSFVGLNNFPLNRDTIVNISNETNGILEAPMSDNIYYIKNTGEADEDGLVVIEYKRDRVVNNDNRVYNNCVYTYIKYPKTLVNINQISRIQERYIDDNCVIYSQTFDNIEIKYSSYKNEVISPINLFDGNYKTNGYFGVEAKNGYNINTGEYIGTNRYVGEGIGINGEWFEIKLDTIIRLRKYEFIINLENVFNTSAPGKWKLYYKNENDRFILLDEMTIRMTTNNANDYYYKLDDIDKNVYIFTKNICYNDVQSDTYLLIITCLAQMGMTNNNATMRYLGFSELNLYDGETSTLRGTNRDTIINNGDIRLVLR